MPPSDAYVRSFLYLLYTLIKLYYTHTHTKKTHYPNVHATLFTIGRTWKQSRYSSTNEWVKKIWYIYIMEYYSAIKRNEIESVAVMWMNLETVIQSEII